MKKKKLKINFENFEKFYIQEPLNRSDYRKISNFERKKYYKYLKILSLRFNKIHGLNLSYDFWNKVFFYFLLIHITQCYRLFRSKKNLRKFNTIICSKIKKFPVPENQTHHRDLFHKSFLGQEKIFDTLILEYKTLSRKRRVVKSNLKQKKNKNMNIVFSKQKFIFREFFLRFINFFYKIFITPNILLTKCYWSNYNKHLIKFDFKGKISTHDFFIPFYMSSKIWKNERNSLTFNEKNFDDFDKFFFKTLDYSIPKSFLENFNQRYKYTIQFLNQKKYAKLKYILNENLEENSLLLWAVGQLKKIKSVYIEHNFIHYPFLGSHLELILSNVDKYFSNGWGISKIKKIKKWGSLSHMFDYKNLNKNNNKKQIGFICGIPNSRYPFTASFWGECGYKNSIELIKNYKIFFKNLNYNIFKKIKIKRHPLISGYITSCYNNIDNNFFKNQMFKSKFFPTKFTFGTMLPKLSLAIMPYYSTPFLQSLTYNLPTIVFINKNAYFTEKNFNSFFKDLIDAGVIHKSPLTASKLVNQIADNPKKWWVSKKVQNARRKFLRNNLRTNKNLNLDLKNLLDN
tara:strand:+ start:434 stop:2146 length:1713 start_codon:yes stop_codon:yes gene_type:complete